MRYVVESNRFFKEHVLYGNYGGPGCLGGVPTDELDEIFRQHDLSYLRGVKLSELIQADRDLIEKLEALDTSQLSPQAEAYRRRAIRYFQRPISRIVGKPPKVVFGIRDRPNIIDISPQK